MQICISRSRSGLACRGKRRSVIARKKRPLGGLIKRSCEKIWAAAVCNIYRKIVGSARVRARTSPLGSPPFPPSAPADPSAAAWPPGPGARRLRFWGLVLPTACASGPFDDFECLMYSQTNYGELRQRRRRGRQRRRRGRQRRRRKPRHLYDWSRLWASFEERT